MILKLTKIEKFISVLNKDNVIEKKSEVEATYFFRKNNEKIFKFNIEGKEFLYDGGERLEWEWNSDIKEYDWCDSYASNTWWEQTPEFKNLVKKCYPTFY